MRQHHVSFCAEESSSPSNKFRQGRDSRIQTGGRMNTPRERPNTGGGQAFTPLAGYRSGLRSSFPAWPICCSTFRPWSASLALPTAGFTVLFADFCDTVKVNRFTLSHESVTCHRSPEVSSTAFDTQPPDLPPVSLMDMGFAIICPLARHRRPHIRFLYIGSRLCSALLSGLASRRVLFHPCASLSLHVHHVVKRIYTS